MSRARRTLDRLAATLQSTLYVGIAAFVAWSSDRGFDITDEGYYLLAVRSPDEVGTFYPSAWHRIAAPLYSLAGGNIALYRLFGLVLMIASGAVLAVGLIRFLDRSGFALSRRLGERVVCGCFIGLGMMLYYVMFLRTPSYNLSNAVVLNAACGLFCLALAPSPSERHASRHRSLLWLMIGLCVGAALLIKVSTGICLTFFLVSVTLLWPDLPPTRRAGSLAPLALGAGSFALLYFTLFQSPSAWWQMFWGGFASLRTLQAGYGSQLLVTPYRAAVEMLENGFLAFWPLHVAVLVGFAILGMLRRLRAIPPLLPRLLIALVLGLAAAVSFRMGFYTSSAAGGSFGSRLMDFYSGWLLLLISISGAGVMFRGGELARQPLRGQRLTLLAAFLVAMPVVGAIGTANPLTTNMLFHLAPLFAALFLLLLFNAELHASRPLLLWGTSLIGVFAFTQVLLGGLQHPYPEWRRGRGILEHVVVTEIGYPPTRLKLHPDRSAVIDRLRSSARAAGFRPRDDLLAFYNIPGVVFALGGSSPGVPWYIGGHAGTREAAQEAVASIPAERLAAAFILERPMRRTPLPDLSRHGIRFPEDYLLLDAYRGFRLWKPREGRLR